MISRPLLRPQLLLSALALAASIAMPAAQAADTLTSVYQQPSAEIRAVLDAQPLPNYLIAPDQRTLAQLTLKRYRSIAELARPVLRLAGIRIDPAASGPQLIASIESLKLQDLVTPGAAAREVALPAGGGFHQLRWSPDGKRFLLNRRTARSTELWVGDVASARIEPIKCVQLNTILENDVAWLSNGELIVLAVPERRGEAPVFEAPSGPTIQESMGRP